MSNWKAIVGTVAPALATALGGPLAGVAVKAIADKVLGKPAATEADVAAAIEAQDRARAREIATKDWVPTGSRSRTRLRSSCSSS